MSARRQPASRCASPAFNLVGMRQHLRPLFDRVVIKELEPDRVLVMPDGTVDHWSDDLVELVALA